MRNNARPEIRDTIENFDEYDVIYVGYPIWNSDLPPIINTFLEQYNFDGKTVVPFCTHGGSGLSGTPTTIANKLPNSTVIQNYTVQRENEVINFTKKEFELLYKLLSFPDKIFTKMLLYIVSWNWWMERLK